MNHNMMLNRPSYLDYSSHDTNKQEPAKNYSKPNDVFLFLFSNKINKILKEVILIKIRI